MDYPTSNACMHAKELYPLSVQYVCVIDMVSGKYRNISIPAATFLRLTKLVGYHGFRSTAEVVMDCIRRQEHQISMWLDKIEKENILHDIKESG